MTRTSRTQYSTMPMSPTVEASAAERRTLAIGYVLAFFSGLAALIYEVTWARMLALTFGGTTLPTAAVVAGFLGGMGIGASLYHRVRGHESHPLRLYALLEIGIAVTAAALSSILYALPEQFARLAAHIPAPAMQKCVGVVVVLLLLTPPAMLMGATFPALCRALIHSARGVDRRLGWIYGINTLGAASGALLAGLFLAEWLGLRGSSLLANGINVAVAVGALALHRGRATTSAPVAELREVELIETRLPRLATGSVLAISGFCTLGYEILWFRGLKYLVGASSYSFSIVLFIFLTGLGLGSLLLRRAAARRAPERDLIVVQCLVAVLSLCGIALQHLVLSQPVFYEHLSIFVPEVRESPWGRRLFLDACVAILTLLPATLFMGLSFPLATRLFLGDVRRLDTRVGSAYLIANVGSILGALLGAVLLLPQLGTIGGTKACAALNMLAALVVAFALRERSRTIPWLLVATGGIVAVLSLRLPRSLPLLGEEIVQRERVRQVFLEEGDLSTVKVQQIVSGPAGLEMSLDGYKIGWSEALRGTPLYEKQVLIADLPLVLDSRIRRTLSIGLGSSATLCELGREPRLESLVCVEINGAVTRGARLFPEARVLADPRARVLVEDAVHYLLRCEERYDLIVSDGKQDPFYSGTASLLSREFYRFANDRLVDPGMLVQWFPMGTLASDLRTIVATLCEVFPEVDAFCFPPYSLLLVAGREPLSSRPPLSEAEFTQRPLRQTLAAYGFDRSGAMLAHWVAGHERLAAATAGVPICHWDLPILDVSPFKASASEWNSSMQSNFGMLDQVEEQPSPGSGPKLEAQDARWLASKRLLRRAWAVLGRGDEAAALSLAEQAAGANADDPEARGLATKLRAARSTPGGAR